MLRRILIASLMMAATGAAQDGAAMYKKSCAGCHEGGVPRAPDRDTLRTMYPERILTALVNGSMQWQGWEYTTSQLRLISEFLAAKPFGRDPGAAQTKTAYCKDPSPAFKASLDSPHWNGWGADLANSRAQSADMAGLTAFDLPKLKLKWAFGFPGDVRSYAQPAVMAGRLFVGSSGRRVYSLSASTGCMYWAFEADFSVRTAISVGEVGNSGRHAVYFADQSARAYALDASTGAVLWKSLIETYPGATITGAPKLHAGRLYVATSSVEEVYGAGPDYECCKFRGSVTALDAAAGKPIWKSYTIPEEPHPVRRNKNGKQLWGPSGAGVWSSPTLDLKRRAVYVTTGDSYSDPAASTSDAFVAFDMDTGKLLWSRQVTAGDAYNLACEGGGTNCPEGNGPDFDFGSSPILVNLPGDRRALVAGQKSGIVHAVDPDRNGEILWQTRVGKGGKLGGVQWGSAVDRDNIYVAVSDVSFKKVERGGQKSVLGGALEFDPAVGGGLFALRLTTGEVVWTTPHPGCGSKPGCGPAQSAAVTAIPGAVFSGSMDGHLRAYSTKDGRIIWDVDTAKDYKTVNGVNASGGSLDGPGPVIVEGTLFVNSGYGAWGGMPGNVLLAFSLK